jgi:hypothetical protein
MSKISARNCTKEHKAKGSSLSVTALWEALGTSTMKQDVMQQDNITEPQLTQTSCPLLATSSPIFLICMT